MTEFCIQLVYQGIDLGVVDTYASLSEASIVAAEEVGDMVRLTASRDARNPVEAAALVVASLRQSVPDAAPVMAYRDMVNISDIAERVGVTREAVRHWTSGTRRAAGEFPAPLDMPGGQKVWEWASVHAWLRHNLGMWDGLVFPTHGEFGKIDSMIDAVNSDQSCRVRPVARDWMLVETRVQPASATLATAPRRPQPVSNRQLTYVAVG